MPDFLLERAAGGRVAGVDEVGRGPLAGPVFAAAVVFRAGVPRRLAPLIDDSKALSRAAREAACARLLALPSVEIGIGAASVAEIGALNILAASLLAMRRAVARLPLPPDFALIDGPIAPPLPCPTRAVVEGDARCFSIAAASIVAKVLRDRAMARLAARFPGYGWEENAGYPTPSHRDAIRRLGPTRHHRMGFGLLREFCKPIDQGGIDQGGIQG
jgi:ribonuclease HII